MPKPKTKTSIIQVRVPEPQAEQIKRIAAERGLSASELMRRLINSALRRGVLERV